MTKRYAESNRWSEKFMRGLDWKHKYLWTYIHDHCDHAGLWIADFGLACYRMALNVTEKEAIEAFGDMVCPIKNSDKWFIPEFVYTQYNAGLVGSIGCIKGVKRLFDEYNLEGLYQGYLKANGRLPKGDKDKEQDKEPDKDKDRDKDRDREPDKDNAIDKEPDKDKDRDKDKEEYPFPIDERIE